MCVIKKKKNLLSSLSTPRLRRPAQGVDEPKSTVSDQTIHLIGRPDLSIEINGHNSASRFSLSAAP